MAEFRMVVSLKNGCMGRKQMPNESKILGRWEDEPWIISTDVECSAARGGKPCKHCHSEHEETQILFYDRSKFTQRVWICPRVVFAPRSTPLNEDRYGLTGICLDCILEAADLFKRGLLAPVKSP